MGFTHYSQKFPARILSPSFQSLTGQSALQDPCSNVCLSWKLPYHQWALEEIWASSLKKAHSTMLGPAQEDPWVSVMEESSGELPELPSSKNNYGLSWIPFFKQQGRKDLYNTALSQPGSFPAKQLEKKLLKTKGYSLETVQKQQTRSNTKGTLDNGLQSDCETNLQCHSDRLSCKPSGTSELSQCQKELETSLKEHLTTHLNETIEGHITSIMSRSRYGPFSFTSCMNNEEHKAQKPPDNKDGRVKSICTMKMSVM